MRKIILLITISIFFLPIQPNKIEASPINLDHMLLNDTLLTTLSPYIEEQVSNYYGYIKQFGLYDTEILSIHREREGQFTFKVKVQVRTFEHAHSPPFGKETMTFKVTPAGVKAIDFIHEGDKEEEIVKKFYQDTLTDIKKSFSFNLEPYEPFYYNQLLYKSERQKEYKSLSDIVEKIIVSILNPETKAPYKNVINPVTYIKGNKGYILFKRADGTNVVYQVEKIDDKWQVIDRRSKKGKLMKKELIWYM